GVEEEVCQTPRQNLLGRGGAEEAREEIAALDDPSVAPRAEYPPEARDLLPVTLGEVYSSSAIVASLADTASKVLRSSISRRSSRATDSARHCASSNRAFMALTRRPTLTNRRTPTRSPGSRIVSEWAGDR